MTVHYRQPDTIVGHRALHRDGLVRELVALGLDVDPSITEALALVDSLDRRRATWPTAVALRDITANTLLADPAADVDTFIDDELRRDTVVNALLDAGDRARSQLARLLSQRADDLHGLVRDRIADPAISTFVAASKLPAGLTAVDALRNGDHAAAETLAHVGLAASQYLTALRLRRLIYPKSDLDLMACSIWQNPNQIEVADLEPGVRRWVEGCRRGGVMMFGSYSETHAASVKAETEKAEATQAAHAARWGTIGTPTPRRRAKAVAVTIPISG